MAFVDIWGDWSSIDRHMRGSAGPLPPFPFLLSGREAGVQGITPAVGLLCLQLPGFRQPDARGTDLAEKRGQGASVPDSSWWSRLQLLCLLQSHFSFRGSLLNTQSSLFLLPTVASSFEPLLPPLGCCAVLCGPNPLFTSRLPGAAFAHGDFDGYSWILQIRNILCRLLYNLLFNFFYLESLFFISMLRIRRLFFSLYFFPSNLEANTLMGQFLQVFVITSLG